MTNFYFNHSCLQDADVSEIERKLIELTQLVEILRRNNSVLFVIQEFWNISINGEKLSNYLYKYESKEFKMAIILAIMDSGPYFEMVDDFSKYPPLITNPKVEDYTFEYPFLYTCFLEEQEFILSCAEPRKLNSSAYSLFVEDQNLDMQNICGANQLALFNAANNSPRSISDVFQYVERERENLIILPSAIKSAMRHHFKDLWLVQRLLIELHDFEFENQLDLNINREQLFYERTGIQISRESTATLSVRRFREEREFIIPGRGKQLFDWHAKLGSNTRVHYFVDYEERKIFIGHCGKHLGTVSYNS